MDFEDVSQEEMPAKSSLFLSVLFIVGVFSGVFIGFFVSWFNIIYIALHKVDKNTKKHGGEIVAEVLKKHGVEHLFTLVGGHISPILVASEKIGIKVVDTRHEATAVFAADAVARLSGNIGVAVVTAGPGVTNTITAVKNAQLAESPVLIIGGAAAGLLKGRGALQDIEQMALFSSVCKYSVSVHTVRDIIPSLKYAIQEARSGTPGPVFVEIPIDVLYPYEVVKKELLGRRRTTSLKNRLINWYFNNYLQNIFAGAWEEREITVLPPIIQRASPKQIKHSTQLLSRAKRPLLLVGSQAILPPTSVQAIRRSVENLGIPCYLGGMARGLLGKNNKLQLIHCRKDVLCESDLVILAGTVADFRLQYGRVLPKNGKIIIINRSKEQLYKNTGMFWKPTLAVCADVGSYLEELALSLFDFKCDEHWMHKLKEREEVKEEVSKKMAEEAANQYLNPLAVLYNLEKHLPDNAILIADGGDFVGSAAYILRPRGPLGWLDPGPFGTLGVGAGFALGAKLCRPDSEVWILYGDGSCGFSIPEIDTFRRHKVPVIAIVGNDAGWSQIKREQAVLFGSSVACQLEYTEYDKVAEGFGGKGYLASKETDDLTSIIKEAQHSCAKGLVVLINVFLGKSRFREGSSSV